MKKIARASCNKLLKSSFHATSLLPVASVLLAASAPLEKRMESSCLRGGGLRSGEQQDGVNARILAADTE